VYDSVFPDDSAANRVVRAAVQVDSEFPHNGHPSTGAIPGFSRNIMLHKDILSSARAQKFGTSPA
jgi:hypothetical protein